MCPCGSGVKVKKCKCDSFQRATDFIQKCVTKMPDVVSKWMQDIKTVNEELMVQLMQDCGMNSNNRNEFTIERCVEDLHECHERKSRDYVIRSGVRVGYVEAVINKDGIELSSHQLQEGKR